MGILCGRRFLLFKTLAFSRDGWAGLKEVLLLSWDQSRGWEEAARRGAQGG